MWSIYISCIHPCQSVPQSFTTGLTLFCHIPLYRLQADVYGFHYTLPCEQLSIVNICCLLPLDHQVRLQRYRVTIYRVYTLHRLRQLTVLCIIDRSVCFTKPTTHTQIVISYAVRFGAITFQWYTGSFF